MGVKVKQNMKLYQKWHTRKTKKKKKKENQTQEQVKAWKWEKDDANLEMNTWSDGGTFWCEREKNTWEWWRIFVWSELENWLTHGGLQSYVVCSFNLRGTSNEKYFHLYNNFFCSL